MSKILTVELSKDQITPLALGVLQISLDKKVNESTRRIQLDIHQSILRKIARHHQGGISAYLEQKVREYIQCLIFWSIVEILSWRKVSIHMQYFTNDLMHGRDALMGNGNRERVALDVTSPGEIETKVNQVRTVEGRNTISRQRNMKDYYLEERLWKLAVGIPSKLTGIALWEIRNVGSFDPGIIRSKVHTIVSDSNHHWLVDTIRVVWLNRKWESHLAKLFQGS